ncbi:MAG: RsmE family RNA methyltransferase [Gammaproteobacteria bacterium]|jgi:16S rRNA (uracil1498-N3)-methyltransferase
MKADRDKNKKSPPLFILESFEPEQQRVVLPHEEAGHAIKALRMRAGDPIHITDGAGTLGQGVINRIEPKQNVVVIDVSSTTNQPSATSILTLASAIPKGERQAVLIDMAVQLGIDVFVPLDCEFSAVRYQSKMRERWLRVARSACKQSRRLYLPRVEDSQTVNSLLNHVPDHSLVVYGSQHGESIYHIPEGIISSVRHVVLLIGPEGGFSDVEQSTLERFSGAFALRAGEHILRTEAAAIALVTLAMQIKQRLS